MNRLTLVIGNKNYSSWSLRAWLSLKQSGAAFDELRIPLDLRGVPVGVTNGGILNVAANTITVRARPIATRARSAVRDGSPQRNTTRLPWRSTPLERISRLSSAGSRLARTTMALRRRVCPASANCLTITVSRDEAPRITT